MSGTVRVKRAVATPVVMALVAAGGVAAVKVLAPSERTDTAGWCYIGSIYAEYDPNIPNFDRVHVATPTIGYPC